MVVMLSTGSGTVSPGLRDAIHGLDDGVTVQLQQ
jgi:hypothetical protein